MLTAFLLIWLAQYPVDPIRTMDAFKLTSKAQDDAIRRAEQERATARKLEFERRLSDLTTALDDFKNEYGRNQGQVWPAKKAEALRKAIQKLEKTPSWSGAGSAAQKFSRSDN
jgi:hypothetical protein